jgi:uncharacterized membrane protein
MKHALILLPLLLVACGEQETAQPVAAGATPASAEALGPGADAAPPTTAAAPAQVIAPGPTASPPPAVPSPAAAPGAGPAPAPVFQLPMRLVGTEPFWGGRIALDGITISGADRPDMRFPYKDPTVTGAGARFRSQSAGAFPLDVTLVRETCSDGMSDKRYPFEATVVVGKETLKGCAIREAEFGGER